MMKSKRLRILLFWTLLIITTFVGLNIRCSSGNTIPEKLVEKTANAMVENNKTNHEIIDIEKIDADLLNKYEFQIAIDLSKSVHPNLDKDDKNNIYVDLVNKIKKSFVDRGLKTQVYFFGTDLVKIKQEDVANFALSNLEQYKNTSFSVSGISRKLEGSTDILKAVQRIIKDTNTEDEDKEKFVIFISDDMHATFNSVKNIEELAQSTLSELKEMGNTSFLLYKYPGKVGNNGVKNFIGTYFSDVFKNKNVKLEKIASELVENLKYSMYNHELSTVKNGSPTNMHSCDIDDKNYKKYNATIFNNRFRLDFLGTSSGLKPEPIYLYPSEEITYLNFNFINDYNYFPIKIKLKEISFCSDSLATIEFKNDLKFDEKKRILLDDFVLKPDDNEIWTVPVSIKYENNSIKSIKNVKEAIQLIKIDYEIDFLGNDDKLYENIYKNLEPNLKNNFLLNSNSILSLKGSQINQLTSTLPNGDEENLVLKTYQYTLSIFIILLFISLIYYVSYLTNRKPKLDNWKIIINNKEKIIKKGAKVLRIKGDNEDPKGDVIIKAKKYNFSFNPFIKQPKDSLLVYFKYGGDKINKKGEIIGTYKEKVLLKSNKSIHAKIYDDIDIKIF